MNRRSPEEKAGLVSQVDRLRDTMTVKESLKEVGISSNNYWSWKNPGAKNASNNRSKLRADTSPKVVVYAGSKNNNYTARKKPAHGPGTNVAVIVCPLSRVQEVLNGIN